VYDFGLPSVNPSFCFAIALPSCVRSTIISRSNSANPEKMLATDIRLNEQNRSTAGIHDVLYELLAFPFVSSVYDNARPFRCAHHGDALSDSFGSTRNHDYFTG
jgi:hypothetical protein